MGMSANNVPNVSFEEVKRASESGDTMIVDVRREDEVKSSGIIPNSVQIPLAYVKEAFDMGEEEFNNKFGRHKPNKIQPLYFSCQAGIRASIAAATVKELGYDARCYSGSWAEWSSKSTGIVDYLPGRARGLSGNYKVAKSRICPLLEGVESNVLLSFPANIRKVLIAEVTNYLYTSSAAGSGNVASTVSTPTVLANSVATSNVSNGAFSVSIVPSSSVEGIPSLSTLFHVKWVMEILGQAFSLPLDDISIAGNAASLYIQWLVDPSKRPPVIQNAEYEEQQKFIQTIFRQLSLLFLARKIDAVGAAKPVLATLAAKHVDLCKLVLKTFLRVANSPAVGNSTDRLSQATWKVLLRVLLGVTDYLLRMPLQPYCYLSEDIGEQLLSTMMELWLRSQVFSASLWASLRKYYTGWCHLQLAVAQWSAMALALTQRITKIIYGQGANAVVYTIHSNLISLELSDKYVVYAWQQCLHLIGKPVDLNPNNYFRAVLGMDKLVQLFHAFKAEQPDSPAIDRILPNGNTILNLFGGWLFDAVNRTGSECIEGRAQAFGILCRIFAKPQHRQPFLTTYLHQFYAALLNGLKDDPLCLVFIIVNSEDIFSLGLPGVRILAAPFVLALRRILPVVEKHLRITLNMDDLRRACYKLLCTIFSFCDHFGSALLRTIDPLQASLPTALPVSGAGVQGISMSGSISSPKTSSSRVLSDQELQAASSCLAQLYSQCGTLSTGTLTLATVRYWVMDTIVTSLIVEKDPHNIRYIINTLTTFAMDDFERNPRIVHYLVTLFVEQVASGKWNVDVALVAIEAIRQLSIFDEKAIALSEGAIVDRLVPSLCGYLDSLVSKNNLPVYFRLITSIMDSLLSWTLGHSSSATWLASNIQCQQEIIGCLCKTIGYGRGISRKIDVVPDSPTPAVDGRSKKSLSTSPSTSIALTPVNYSTSIAGPPLPKSLEYQLALSAEIALDKLLSFLGTGLVNPFAPTHPSTLLNEAILLNESSSKSDNVAFVSGKPRGLQNLTKEQMNSLRYFVINRKTIVCFVEREPNLALGKNQDVVMIVRTVAGRFSWESSLVYSVSTSVAEAFINESCEQEMPATELPKNHLRQSFSLNDLFASDQLLADSFEKQSLLVQTCPELRAFPVQYDEVCNVFNENLAKGRLERDDRRKANYHYIENLTRDQILKCRKVLVQSGSALRSIRATQPAPKNAEDHYARLLLSQMGLSMLANRERAQRLPVCPELMADMEVIDSLPEREVACCSVWYVRSCRDDLAEIMQNDRTYSMDYLQFVHSLGWPIDLRKHAGFDGGLDADLCPTVPYYANNDIEMVYHVPQLMNSEAVSRTQQRYCPVALPSAYAQGLYSIMADDLVSIVWTEDFQDILTLPNKLLTRSIVYICVSPLKDPESCGLYRIRITITSSAPTSGFMANGPSGATSQQHPSEAIFLFGPLLDGMIIRREALGRLVRETAISASFFCLYGLQHQTKPGIRRAQVLEKMIQKYHQATPVSK